MIRLSIFLFSTIAAIFLASAQTNNTSLARLSLSSSQIRIACVGNSITYGAGVANREKNAYPAQLQNMLGSGYEVMNFGVNGSTLLKRGNLPYWQTDAYGKALASNPDIVFIKLGTNDSKAINRPFYDDFVGDYKAFIHSFRQLPSHPRVVLLLPVPSFLTDSTSIFDPIIQQQIIPRIQQVAFETGCELINLYPLFSAHKELLPDNIHPSSIGATVIAKRLYEVVNLKEKSSYDVFSSMKMEKKISSFYGFECADFSFQNRACKVVKPKRAAEGLPWIWRARFWGHEPQTDLALLERGFHLVYCDVAELFGNATCIRTWDSFYTYLRQFGFAPKVVLEGMSRGGIYIYNWALKNPDKVSCIYADAPVLDIKSWPGGKGTGPGSKSDWELFKKQYGLSEEQANSFRNSPLDNAARIAKLKFPMLHVVGDADEVVPVDENTGPFEIAVKKAGGNITVIHKPGVKHHPHSLTDPTPIVDFILRATGRKINFATLAVPGAEYRSAAGWVEGHDWWAQYSDIESLLKKATTLDILFVGNSITQGCGGNRSFVTYTPGKRHFDSIFMQYKWETAGISGDRTQHILWRLQNGSYQQAKPKVLVLTLGVNNFWDDSAEEIAEGIFANLNWLQKNMSHTQIILCGPLPAGVPKNSMLREKYAKVHAIISKYKFTNVHYHPLHQEFIQADGSLDLNFYEGDGIHLKPAGYKEWALVLLQEIRRLLH